MSLDTPVLENGLTCDCKQILGKLAISSCTGFAFCLFQKKQFDNIFLIKAVLAGIE